MFGMLRTLMMILVSTDPHGEGLEVCASAIGNIGAHTAYFP